MRPFNLQDIQTFIIIILGERGFMFQDLYQRGKWLQGFCRGGGGGCHDRKNFLSGGRGNDRKVGIGGYVD